jgi:hypothetical protein
VSFSLYAEVNHNRRGFQRSWDQKKAWEYSPPNGVLFGLTALANRSLSRIFLHRSGTGLE